MPVPRFPVIVGPTAGGKSALAVEVALELEREGHGRGEIVTADAFQVYRGLDIGTAKPTEDERRGVVHHLIDVVEPGESFSASDWLKLAMLTIDDIKARGGVPIVAGGTNLYIKSLMEGMFEGPGADEALREQLRAMSAGERRAELERVDPAAAARIHPNDERRTIRALEVHRLTGKPISEWQGQWDRDEAPTDRVLVGLTWDREALNARINERVRRMMADGLLDEVRRLHDSGRLTGQAGEALGYKQLVRNLKGEWTLDEAVEQVKIETGDSPRIKGPGCVGCVASPVRRGSTRQKSRGRIGLKSFLISVLEAIEPSPGSRFGLQSSHRASRRKGNRAWEAFA